MYLRLDRSLLWLKFYYLLTNILSLFHRGSGQNHWPPLPLLHCSLELVRFPAGPGFDLGDTYGGHHDRFPCVSHVVEGGQSVPDWENTEAYQGNK